MAAFGLWMLFSTLDKNWGVWGRMISIWNKLVFYFYYFKNGYSFDIETSDCEIRLALSTGEIYVLYVSHSVIKHLMQSGTVVSGYQRFLNYLQKATMLQAEFRLLEEKGKRNAVPLKQAVAFSKADIIKIMTKDKSVKFKIEKEAYSLVEHVRYPQDKTISTTVPQTFSQPVQQQVASASAPDVSDDMLDYQAYVGRV